MSSIAINVDMLSRAPVYLQIPTVENLPTLRHFLAAGTASAVASGAFSPLDCLRVRWQTQNASEQSIVAFGRRIVQQEGLWQGLWRPGVGANVMGMGVASALRFGYYETIRNSLPGKEKEGWHMAVAGLVCGASAYFITTPFHLIKTRLQAEAGRRQPFASNVWQGIRQIVTQTGHVSSLYKGSIPLALRGSFFTAGQMVGTLCCVVLCCVVLCCVVLCCVVLCCVVLRPYSPIHSFIHLCSGYDGLKTMAKKRGYDDGPWLHVLSSISSAFFASFLSAPADYVMARYMISDGKSVGECVRIIYKQGGVRAFWKGWGVFFVRLTPVLLTYSSVYEQLRYQFGLGYLN
jgi:hypothetical protein